jgi:tetratricopeptide (TPR) repeat protein
MGRISWPHATLAVAVLSACAHPGASRPAASAPPAAEEAPALERAFSRDSTNLQLRLRLAEAERRAGRLDVAARLLQPAAQSSAAAAFELALVREDQHRYDEARRLYEQYVSRGDNAALRAGARDRLALVGRLELQQAVTASLARERELAAQAPEPRTVGVFPFLTASSDSALSPLGTALAELLSVDLAQTDRLKVVERARVQTLLDEIRLGESRRVDPASAARPGRVLGAGVIVQGRVDGASPEVALQVVVVRVPANRAANTPLRERNPLARVLDAEKRLALGIYDRLGVQLTTAERQRISHQQTSNVQALLELGYGLEAQDAGRYDDAQAHFARAVQLDPGFGLAKAHADDAAAQARAARMSLASLAAAALGAPGTVELAGRGAGAAPSVVAAPDRFRAIERLIPDPSVREPAVEALGVEGISRRGTVDIVIRRP